jgi:hypothetical protein
MDAIRNAMHKCLDAAMNDAADNGNNSRIRPSTIEGEPIVGRHIQSNSFSVRIQVSEEFEKDGKTGRTIGKSNRVTAVLTTRVTSVARVNV